MVTRKESSESQNVTAHIFPKSETKCRLKHTKVKSYASQNTSNRLSSPNRQTRNIACQINIMPQSHPLDPVYKSCGTQTLNTQSLNLQSPDKPVSEN